ncbi:MAG TPA: endonuclease V, partial [Archaeoglobaceae archaeon]|nr:endonuclease V [Archaeoglobaceae archaeon]
LSDKYHIDEINYVAGVDQSFAGERIISSCVLLEFPSLKPLKGKTTVEKVNFPYIPTFLMFREGMPAVRAVKSVMKDYIGEKIVILVDGSGIAHPRRCGLACYISIKTEIPSVGITKKKLFGKVKEPERVYKSEPLMDGEELIGFSLKTCKRCKPIYVSPGSYITPESALLLTKKCLKGHKLPEPVRIAHSIATKAKKKFV